MCVHQQICTMPVSLSMAVFVLLPKAIQSHTTLSSVALVLFILLVLAHELSNAIQLPASSLCARMGTRDLLTPRTAHCDFTVGLAPPPPPPPTWKLDCPCMLGVEISWWMTARLEEQQATALCRLCWRQLGWAGGERERARCQRVHGGQES